MTWRAAYDFHGVRVAIDGSGTVGDEARLAIDRRLRLFRTGAGDGDPEAQVGIHVGGEALAEPAGVGRPVYESAAGPVRYHDAEGVLFAAHRLGAQLRCRPAAGEADLACRPSSPDSVWVATHPLLTIALIELLKQRRRYSLHAACVASGEEGILIAGPSGAGKSTLAVALARSGLDFLSDDMVFLAVTPGGLEVQGFADEVDVTDDTLAMFGELRPAARRQLAGGEKWSLRLEDALATPTARRCRPALLVLARVAHRDHSRMTSMAASEAFVELAPNVLLTDGDSAQAHLAALAQLARTTPCVRLEAGRDLEELPARLTAACAATVAARAAAASGL